MAKLIDEVYLLHETSLLRLEKVAVLSNRFKREFTKMLTKVRRAMNEESKNFKKEKILFQVPNRNYRAEE